jgi:hypothetical protein
MCGRVSSRFLLALAASALVTACGDPLVTASYRGDPIFTVRGNVTLGLEDDSREPAAEGEGEAEPAEGEGEGESPAREGEGEVAPAAPQEVGVIWLNLLDDNATVLIEATPTDAIGNQFHADVDVFMLQPPSDDMLGTTLVTYGEDGSSAAAVDRSRVAFGIVVVAPEGTLANLPSSTSLQEFISSSGASTGPLLSQFTYVSPFTVRFVKGASAEGLTIRDINGVESALQDMAIFDVSNWAAGIDTALCRDRRLGEGWQAPEFQACIVEKRAANDAAIACRADCGTVTDETTDEERAVIDACQLACPAERTLSDIENTCLYEYAETRAAETDAVCGVRDFAESDFRNSRQLDPNEELTLSLGEGDIRSALTAGGFVFLG